MANRLKYYPDGIKDEKTFRRAVRDYFHTQSNMCALEGAWYDISVHIAKFDRILNDHLGTNVVVDQIMYEINELKKTLEGFVKESEGDCDDLQEFAKMIRDYKPDYDFETKP